MCVTFLYLKIPDNKKMIKTYRYFANHLFRTNLPSQIETKEEYRGKSRLLYNWIMG